jgi:site-specific recombinase XerD
MLGVRVPSGAQAIRRLACGNAARRRSLGQPVDLCVLLVARPSRTLSVESGLFFVRPDDGRAWHPQTVSDRFEHLITESRLPPVRLHDLRHCAAIYLCHGGADLKEIQETLGHANIAITSDTYTSVILELHRTNADAAAQLIPRRPPTAA